MSGRRQTHLPQLVTEEALAHRWAKSVRTLQRMRRAGTGPAWLRVGASVFYRIKDVQTYETRARREGMQP